MICDHDCVILDDFCYDISDNRTKGLTGLNGNERKMIAKNQNWFSISNPNTTISKPHPNIHLSTPKCAPKFGTFMPDLRGSPSDEFTMFRLGNMKSQMDK